MIGVNMYEEKIPPIKSIFKEDKTFLSIISFQFKTIIDFAPLYPYLSFILISLFWFLLKYGDIYLFLFFLDLSIFLYSNFVLLAFDAYHFGFISVLFTCFFNNAYGFSTQRKRCIHSMANARNLLLYNYCCCSASEKSDPIIFTKLSTFGLFGILIGTTVVLCINLWYYKNTN